MLLDKINFDLTKNEVIAVTVAMMGVARVDGIKQEEEFLIKNFYSSAPEDMPAFEGLNAYWAEGGYDMPSVVADSDKREFMVYLMMMTAYADGHMSPAEEAFIQNVASDVGVSVERFTEMKNDVREELLSTLAGLPDSSSVAKVASEM